MPQRLRTEWKCDGSESTSGFKDTCIAIRRSTCYGTARHPNEASQMLSTRIIICIYVGLLASCLASTPKTALAEVVREHTLQSSFTGQGHFFGTSVAIDGNVALVGEPFGGTNAIGTAQLFDIETGRRLATLTAADFAYINRFGSSVAIRDNHMLIGSPGNESAYLFDRDTFQQKYKLTASEGNAYGFGYSVALSGDTAVVGAYKVDGFAGAAYVFDVPSGRELFKLTASDPFQNARIGESVAIDGNIAVVGGAHGSGAAYVFDVTTGQQLFKLQSPDPMDEYGTGDSVAIDGNLAIVGSQGNRAAYLFDVTTGNLLTTLLSPSAPTGDSFGRWVAIHDSIALVAGTDMRGRNSQGIHVFDTNSGLRLLTFSVGVSLESIIQSGSGVVGRLLGINDDTIIVGTPGQDGPTTDHFDWGAAHVFSYDIPLLGDTDTDGDVDGDDLNNVRNNFGEVGPDDGTLSGDAFPFDGLVNIDDLNNVRNHFGEKVAALKAVPEPGGLTLALLGLIFGTRLSRHRRKRRHERLRCDVPYG